MNIPKGYKLVPVECDDDIAEAIAGGAKCCGGGAYEIWIAALAAAPEAPQIELEQRWETLRADLSTARSALVIGGDATNALRVQLNAMIQQFGSESLRTGKIGTDRQRQVLRAAEFALSDSKPSPPPSYTGEDDFGHRERDQMTASAAPPEGWVHCSPAWLQAGGNCAHAKRWHNGGAIGPHYHPPISADQTTPDR